MADDDADIRDLVVFKLDNAGFTVKPAADGDEALRLIAEHRPERARSVWTLGVMRIRDSVADTGMGIPAEDLTRLFSRFLRASNAPSGHVPGTGLGLVIVRTIAEAHDGQVDLTSTEGEGTTVILTLPVSD